MNTTTTERTVLFKHYNIMSVYDINVGAPWYLARAGKTDSIKAAARREIVAEMFARQFMEDAMFSLEGLDYKAMGY